MARDGAGTYTRTHADYVYGEVIDQVAINAELNDIAAALTGSLTGKFWWGGTAGGTADARTITPSPSISAYAAGQEWVFINGGAANATATPTLAISGLAARTGKRADGSALVPGDWPANALIRLIDDGTNLRLAERMGGSFTGSIIQAEGAAVASAATTNIWANDGDTVHITGTTTITSFGTAVQAGQWKKVIFDGALTLTHGANLSLPGSANITTAADDMAFVYADTTTQFDVIYFKKSGGAVKAPTIQVFTATGTWTKPTGLLAVRVKMVGGGGGGGGVDATAGSKSTAGTGSGYAEKLIAATALGATEAVTVGNGGTAGTSAPSAGGAASDSSFGTHLANIGGGRGGPSGTAGAANPARSNAATTTGGDFSWSGQPGQSGREGGCGGDSFFGGGGVPDQGDAGQQGVGYGAGGSGAVSTGTAVAGGAGRNGIVIVEEFY